LVVQVPGRPRALPVRAAAHLVGGPEPGRSALRGRYLDAEREPRFEPVFRAEPREALLRPELRALVLEEVLLADVLLRDDDREPPRRLLEDEDRPPLLDALRLGSFLRSTLAISRSSFSLMESAMCFEAPLRLDLDRSPRLADKAAPAAICCFPDLAFGIVSSSVLQNSETPRASARFLTLPLRKGPEGP
jgi:hypothetical protein